MLLTVHSHRFVANNGMNTGIDDTITATGLQNTATNVYMNTAIHVHVYIHVQSCT